MSKPYKYHSNVPNVFVLLDTCNLSLPQGFHHVLCFKTYPRDYFRQVRSLVPNQRSVLVVWVHDHCGCHPRGSIDSWTHGFLFHDDSGDDSTASPAGATTGIDAATWVLQAIALSLVNSKSGISTFLVRSSGLPELSRATQLYHL